MGHPEVVGLLQRHIEALEREARGEFVLPPDHDTEFDSFDEQRHEYDNLGFGAPMAAASAEKADAAKVRLPPHRNIESIPFFLFGHQAAEESGVFGNRIVVLSAIFSRYGRSSIFQTALRLVLLTPMIFRRFNPPFFLITPLAPATSIGQVQGVVAKVAPVAEGTRRHQRSQLLGIRRRRRRATKSCCGGRGGGSKGIYDGGRNDETLQRRHGSLQVLEVR